MATYVIVDEVHVGACGMVGSLEILALVLSFIIMHLCRNSGELHENYAHLFLGVKFLGTSLPPTPLYLLKSVQPH